MGCEKNVNISGKYYGTLVLINIGIFLQTRMTMLVVMNALLLLAMFFPEDRCQKGLMQKYKALLAGRQQTST
jgi:hypothetical protein